MTCMRCYSIFFLSIFIFVLSFCLQSHHAFRLEGSRDSFAKFPSWNPCQNGSFTFEFNTAHPNGLLVYMDDGGKIDFLELKLVGGVVRLRLNLGEGTTILAVGQNLNDRQWHKVEVARNEEDTTLIVDKESQSEKSPGTEFAFGNMTQNSFAFVGGMPAAYDAMLSLMALPSVVFEPSYNGYIRNLLYSNCGASLVRMDMLDSRGVRTNKLDRCEEENPCKNGGICISTDTGLLCDCSGTEYQGTYCNEGEYNFPV